MIVGKPHLLLVQPVLPGLENGPAGIFLRLVQALHIVHHDLAVEAVLDPRGSLVQRPTAGRTSVIMAVPVTARHFGFGRFGRFLAGAWSRMF